jgi:acyl-CoA hydrolase
MPADANWLTPLIFGGAFFSEMDICAARTVSKFLEHSPKGPLMAVTHKAEVTYMKPCYLGDLIILLGTVMEASGKHVTVEVTALRGADRVAGARFVFVSINSIDNAALAGKPEFLPYVNHGMEYGVRQELPEQEGLAEAVSSEEPR